MQNTFRLPVFVAFMQIPAPDKLDEAGTQVTLDATMVSSFNATELAAMDALTPHEVTKVNNGEVELSTFMKTRAKRKIGCTQIQMLGYTIYVEESYDVVKDVIIRALKDVNKGS